MRNAFCQYENHEIPGAGIGTLHSYEDQVHGITQIDICDKCLLEHVHKYYPGCAIEQSILGGHPELKSHLTPHALDGDCAHLNTEAVDGTIVCKDCGNWL